MGHTPQMSSHSTLISTIVMILIRNCIYHIFNRHDIENDIENEIEIDSCELLPKLAQLNGGTCRLITRLGDVCELYGPMHTQRPHERSREEAP